MLQIAFGFDDFFKKSEAFERAHVGICIINIKTGEEIYSRQPDKFFVPASLQKIPLSAAALSNLGKDYTFHTDLAYEGKIDKEGVLHGNLWIKGGGDPTLSLDIFSEWKDCLKKEGIKKIKGKIIVDTTLFETAQASPFWFFEDLGNYFGAGASSLNINKNLYHITFKPGAKEGDPAAVIKIDPEIPDLVFHNEVTTGPPGSGDKVSVFGCEYSLTQFYRGTVPIDAKDFTIKAAIPDPAFFCGKHLAKKIDPSLKVEVIRKGKRPALTRIARKDSPSLEQILTDLNHFSINLYAEDILKTIGHGQALQGTHIVETYLHKLNVPACVKDGSGLARTNLITPRGFTKLLCLIYKDPLYKPVYDSFPNEGEGSLKFFPKIPQAFVKAKTGSMSMTVNLGGYIKLESGKEFAFCICCNNYTGSLSDVSQETHKFLTYLSNTR